MGLKENGILVIDFFNANKVIANLLAQEIKELDGIVFTIRKRLEGGIIKKYIQVKNKETIKEYEEKVQALTLKDFKEYFSSSGFELEQVYGSYLLEDFNEEKSDRLILIARKKQHYDKL